MSSVMGFLGKCSWDNFCVFVNTERTKILHLGINKQNVQAFILVFVYWDLWINCIKIYCVWLFCTLYSINY